MRKIEQKRVSEKEEKSTNGGHIFVKFHFCWFLKPICLNSLILWLLPNASEKIG